MFVLIHVVIALSTVAYTAYLYFNPAPNKFSPAYYLLGGTIGSGVLLIFTTGASIIRTCLTGLFFIGLVSAGIIASKHKLATQRKKID